MKKCFVLGAGASHGYDESLPEELRPPTTNDFFNKGKELKILTRQTFPTLLGKIRDYIKKQEERMNTTNLSDLTCDVEGLLQWLATDFSKTTFITDEDFDISSSIQLALGECFYFVYELLKRYSSYYVPRFDNYRRLALHHYNSKYGVVTLNYDTLFEAAIQSVQLNFHYFPWPHQPKSIPIAKLHGSINWVNPCSGGVFLPGIRGDPFPTIAKIIYSNQIEAGQMMVLPISAIRNISYRDYVRSGVDYDEPALIPPLADYKDYEKVKSYKDVWKLAEFLLKDAIELVFIGCSIRPQDKKFNELLQSSAQDGASITVCDKNHDLVMDRLSKVIKNPKFEKPFNSFEEYAKTL